MKRFSQLFIFIILAILAFTVHRSQKAIDQHREIRFVDLYPQYLPKGDMLKALSMGYRGLAADYLWIRTVLYYGRRVMDEDNPYYEYAESTGQLAQELMTVKTTEDQVSDSIAVLDRRFRSSLFQFESRGLMKDIYPMLDRVVTLDPEFELPYIFGGIYVMMTTGEIEAAVNLLEKGRRNNPDNWRFPFYLGWIHWAYIGNIDKAHDFMLEAVTKEKSPAYVHSMAAGLAEYTDRIDITRRFLINIYESTENEEIRKQILNALENLGKHQDESGI